MLLPQERFQVSLIRPERDQAQFPCNLQPFFRQVDHDDLLCPEVVSGNGSCQAHRPCAEYHHFITGNDFALVYTVHAHGERFHQGAEIKIQGLGEFQYTFRVIDGIVIENVRCKGALDTGATDGVAASGGVDHHAITHLHVAYILAYLCDDTGELMAERKRARRTRNATNLGVTEIRAANTAALHSYQYIMRSWYWPFDLVKADIVGGVNAGQGHRIHGVILVSTGVCCWEYSVRAWGLQRLTTIVLSIAQGLC